MSAATLLLFPLRVVLRIVPASVAVAFFRRARSIFSVKLNRWLEDHLFPEFLKGRTETLALPRITVPIPIERKMNIRVGDESQRFYWIGDYDEVGAYVLRHLRAEDLFIDIGANCGFVTLLASSVVLADRLWCFEPNPETFRELQANLAVNELPAHARNLGLSDVAGRARLFVPDGACGGSSIEAQNYRRRDLLPGEEMPARFHEVELVQFDEFWARHRAQLTPAAGGAVVVKIDAEGHEAKILIGMQSFLAENRDRITLLIEVYESEYDAITAALWGHGLTPGVILPDGTPGATDRPEKKRFKNYCFRGASQRHVASAPVGV